MAGGEKVARCVGKSPYYLWRFGRFNRQSCVGNGACFLSDTVTVYQRGKGRKCEKMDKGNGS